jgi:hypothetical protein
MFALLPIGGEEGGDTRYWNTRWDLSRLDMGLPGIEDAMPR